MEDVMRHLQTDPAAKSELQAVLSVCGDPGSRALLERGRDYGETATF